MEFELNLLMKRDIIALLRICLKLPTNKVRLKLFLTLRDS